MIGLESMRLGALCLAISAFAVAGLTACGELADPSARIPPSTLRSTSTNADLRVEVDRDLITVRAREAHLRDVLVSIAAASGLELVTDDPLDERVTADLASLPVAVALRELLRDRSFVLLRTTAAGDRGDARAGTLWVLSSAGGAMPAIIVRRMEELPALGTPADIARLSAAIDHEDVNVRLDAAADLGLVDDPNAQAMLSAAAALDTDPAVRAEALYALGAAQATAWNPAFRLALADANRNVRAAAISALEDLGTQDAAQVLEMALGDTDTSLRASAVEALGEIGGSTARGVLRRALADESNTVCEAAAEQLGTTPHPNDS